MDHYIARANMDHYLGLLDDADLPPHNRSTITKLLIAEEDKLSHDIECLEFAELRTAKSQDRVEHARRLRNTFREGTIERKTADKVVANCEALQDLMEQFCHQMRQKVNASRL